MAIQTSQKSKSSNDSMDILAMISREQSSFVITVVIEFCRKYLIRSQVTNVQDRKKEFHKFAFMYVYVAMT